MAHAALDLWELDALRLEVEAAQLHHPAHIARNIVDHVLVLQLQHVPAQRRVPARHQLNVASNSRPTRARLWTRAA